MLHVSFHRSASASCSAAVLLPSLCLVLQLLDCCVKLPEEPQLLALSVLLLPLLLRCLPQGLLLLLLLTCSPLPEAPYCCQCPGQEFSVLLLPVDLCGMYFCCCCCWWWC
jgi:hypothetical protein